jgi:acyl carrier protein
VSPDIESRIAERQEILARLRQVLIERLHLKRAPDELDPDAPLFGAGFALDSLDAVELVVCLDGDFGVRVSDGAVLREAFRSLNTIADLVLGQREASHVGGG